MSTSPESSLPENKNNIIYSEESKSFSPLPKTEVPLAETLSAGAESAIDSDQGDERGDAGAKMEIPEVPSTIEGQLPLEAQGETNGGPLGCCLGTTIGLLLSISVALLSRFYADPLAHLLGGALSIVTRILMVIVAIIAVIICSYFGWRIGKNVYREYNAPLNPGEDQRSKSH